MGGARIHRAVAAIAMTMMIGGVGMVTAGAAWSAGLHHSKPALRFDTYLRQAVLVIPNPPCPKSWRHCHWMLSVNLVNSSGPRVYVTGTSGRLSLPVDSCGLWQADAAVDIGSYWNWTYVTGIRATIDYCPSTTTTSSSTSTTSTSTTSTTDPPPTSISTHPPPTPTVAASSTTPTTANLPFTGSTTGATSPPTTGAPDAAASATLPFTGVDLRPLLVLGSALILLGGLLLSSYESRRRLLRRAAAVRPSHISTGARRASSWFLGL
jgi:hypothetical protein